MGASSCNPEAPPFKWNPEIWVGDATTESLVRKNSAGNVEQMFCMNPNFNDMVAMKKEEIRKAREAYFDVINQCERWKKDSQDQVVGAGQVFEALEAEAYETN